MLKRALTILILALIQFGCATEDGGEMYKPSLLTPESRQGYERLKREILQLEDIKIGTGFVAAWGRKVEAEIIVRYTDGTVVYQGSSISYQGMLGAVFIHNNVRKSGVLAFQQMGIMLGLNGMAVGGKRKITVQPKLECTEDGSRLALHEMRAKTERTILGE